MVIKMSIAVKANIHISSWNMDYAVKFPGRKIATRSGIVVALFGQLHSGMILKCEPPLNPGESGVAEIFFLADDDDKSKIIAGLSIALCDTGQSVLANAIIQKILSVVPA